MPFMTCAESALHVLAAVSPQLASAQIPWLMRPSLVVTRGLADQRNLLAASRGMVQRLQDVSGISVESIQTGHAPH